MHKPYRVPNDEGEVTDIHRITGIVEPKRASYRHVRPSSRYPLITAFYMLEMVRDYIHQLELE